MCSMTALSILLLRWIPLRACGCICAEISAPAATALYVHEVCPALVSGEDVFERSRCVGWTHLKQQRWVSRLHGDQ
ncbi:hypothetical protein ALP52_200060 [Pseudomonas amygdali pv. mori]|uniref:Secreted protein n=1 Tax=Pseudomonas amygdali pv. mori TaxID=34065 RepID=A0A3M5IUB2_PSEA0|nr:hypothetical protein ALP52_200060 [Pseudomonas amygdali pv. mori]